MNTQWVVNASPIILLGKTGHLELLQHLGTVVVPDAAVLEVEGKPHSDHAIQALVQATWLQRVSVDVIPHAIQQLGLGDGESAVLAHALTNPDFGAILDDQAARRAARTLGIRHLGTLGVVVSAKVNGIIASARSVINELRQHGMYLNDKVIEKALARLGE